MTLSNGPDSDDEVPQSGTALTAVEMASGVEPFIAMASEEVAKPRGLRGLMLDYSAHAAMIVGLIGFAWTVSDHVVSRPPVAPAAKPATVSQVDPAPAKAPDAMAELKETNARMAQDIRQLHANLEALRSTVKQERTPEQMRALTASLETVKTGLVSTKSETSAALAQIASKVDKLQRETTREPAKTVDADHAATKTERSGVDTEATGSLPPLAKSAPIPPVKPQAAKLASVEDVRKVAMEEPAKTQPQVIPGFLVRDVYDGVALVESRRGPIEVIPGVSIPGAGIVKSIDRHGAGWTVTTTKGLLAYAAPTRRSARDTYAPYREDF